MAIITASFALLTRENNVRRQYQDFKMVVINYETQKLPIHLASRAGVALNLNPAPCGALQNDHATHTKKCAR